MNEIYWITVLDNLYGIAAMALITSIIIFAFCWLFRITEFDDSDDRIIPERIQRFKKIKRVTLYSVVVGILSLIIVIFVPTKKDMYLIYGAGNVIDYCQDNPKVKELPDKAVEALNTWLDMVNEENTKQDDKERN